MSKRRISTKLPSVSALQMYYMYIKELLKTNPNYKARIHKSVVNAQIIDELTGKPVFDYRTFKTIIATFNKKAGDKLIKGYALDLGKGLGDFFMLRRERPAKQTAFNRSASFKLRKKLKEEGKLTETNWKVPYTDDVYICLQWHKGNGLLPHIFLYKFKTARGQAGKGFRSKISEANTQNPHLKSLYPYMPARSIQKV